MPHNLANLLKGIEETIHCTFIQDGTYKIEKQFSAIAKAFTPPPSWLQINAFDL